MTKVLLYPTPASRRSMLSKVFAATEVRARPAPTLLPIPFAAEIDREIARREMEAMVARNEAQGRKVPAIAEQAKLARHWARLHHHARHVALSAASRGYTHLAIWNGSGSGKRSIMRQAATAAGLSGVFAELSPFPGRFTLDPRGVNAAGSLPADPQFYRSWAEQHPGAVDLAPISASMRARAGVVRPSQGPQASGPFVFVPLQVHGDTQIVRHGGWIRSIPDLIDQLAEASQQLPAGWRLVFREHPSCKVGNAEQLKRLAGGRISVDNATDTFELVRRSEAVVTLNSSVGLQSFFFGKPVLVLGEANYALPGLATRAVNAGSLADAIAHPHDWFVDEALRQAFLRFLLAEYYVAWPGPDIEHLRRQVHLRLKGRITDWAPASVGQEVGASA